MGFIELKSNKPNESNKLNAHIMRQCVLITGSSGMLGCDLSKELRKSYEACGADLVHDPQSIVHRFVKCDITDKQSVESVVNKVKPDMIIHAAAWTDVDGCEGNPAKAYLINRDGTKNVALACKYLDIPLVYISTDFVFDGRKRTSYKESDRTRPLSAYADSKFQGEITVKELVKKYFIVRTSWLYGSYGKNFVDTIIVKAKTVPVLKVVNDQVGSPTYAKDLSKALHALLDKVFMMDDERRAMDESGIYHLSNSGSVSWYEYAKTILKIVGLKTQVIPISSEELDRPAKRPAMSVLDNSKFRKLTGFRMRNWKVALKDYLSSCHCADEASEII